MKIITVNSNTVVLLDNGEVLQRVLNDTEYYNLCNASTDSEIMEIMCPTYKKQIEYKNNIISILNDVENSQILTKKGDSIYWEDVCELSMPEELVKAVLEAELNGDTDKLEAYKNFWTLMSLNPDSRCRQNLFWFLNRWGMKISKYGLFVGYRNVDIHQKAQESSIYKYTQEQIDFVVYQYDRIKHNKKSPKNYVVDFEYGPNKEFKLIKASDGYSTSNLHELYQYFKERNFDLDLINPNTETIYTDHHSHSFRIKIGEMVTMPRENCDSVQEHSCSRGLHIGGESWLNKNYFGNTGLICLVNPKDVVAVPPYDDYGKLRTCAYLPIGTIKYDEYGKVIPYDLNDGFVSEYVQEVLYNGIKSTEETNTYSLKIPELPELNVNKISNNLIEIANQAIKDRIV